MDINISTHETGNKYMCKNLKIFQLQDMPTAKQTGNHELRGRGRSYV